MKKKTMYFVDCHEQLDPYESKYFSSLNSAVRFLKKHPNCTAKLTKYVFFQKKGLTSTACIEVDQLNQLSSNDMRWDNERKRWKKRKKLSVNFKKTSSVKRNKHIEI